MARWNPQDYQQNSSQQQKWARQVLAKLSLKGHERILDLGCGDGKITAEIAASVPQGAVVGIDASAQMIEFARNSFPANTYPRLYFEQGDARSLNFDGEFDWVVSFACLHWVIDHRPVLAGIARSLHPGGKIMLQFGGKGNAAGVIKAVEQVISRPQWVGYFREFQFPWGFHSPDDYRHWLRDLGFGSCRVELVPKDMVHQGREGFTGWLRTTWMPYLERVPKESQEALLDEMAEAYLEDHPVDEKGLVHVDMVRLEVEATKPRCQN